MSEKICPVCNRSNLPTAKRCWYCQSLLEDEPIVGEPVEGEFDVEPEPEEKEVPDWLARIRARKAIESMEPSEARAEPPQAEKKIEPETPASPPEKPAAPAASGKTGSISRRPGVELPAWITELEREARPVPDEAAPFTPPVEKTESSDWMKKLSAWGNEEESDAAAAKVEPDTTPEWLAEFLGQESAPKPETGLTHAEQFNAQIQAAQPQPGDTEPLGPLTEDEEAMSQDETYDFSSELEPVVKKDEQEIPSLDESELEAGFTPLSVETSPETRSEAPSEPPETVNEAVEDSDLDLEWLTEYSKPASEAPFSSDEAPEAEAEHQPEDAAPPLAPFLGVQEHDWITQPVEPPVEGAEEKAGESDESTPEVPLWMEQLKRIEPSAPPPVPPEEPSASVGPLAGIQGALQGTELPDLYSRPPIYTNKIQVTERQALRAELLTNLLQEAPVAAAGVESQPKSPAKIRLTKLLVGLLILMVVFLVLVAAPGTSLLPVLYPPETANAYQLVNGLSNEKPVLVVGDFDAGLSGEIAYTSQALFEHLMLRDIPMAVLSTNPVGSALTSDMLAAAQSKVANYDLAARTVQFGYLAGGSVAMQTLASDVRTALPYTAELFPAWQNPLLQNVQSVSDFGALIVLTDDGDTGRYWVEQVQPSLAGIPLIMVTSAQSAPMLLPYYESGQINGVISGISGGSAYEQILQLPGDSTFFFGAYQSLVLVVFLLILIGGVIALFLPDANGRNS